MGDGTARLLAIVIGPVPGVHVHEPTQINSPGRRAERIIAAKPIEAEAPPGLEAEEAWCDADRVYGRRLRG